MINNIACLGCLPILVLLDYLDDVGMCVYYILGRIPKLTQTLGYDNVWALIDIMC